MITLRLQFLGVFLFLLVAGQFASAEEKPPTSPEGDALVDHLLQIPRPGRKSTGVEDGVARPSNGSPDDNLPSTNFAIQISSVWENEQKATLQWRKLGNQKQPRYDELVKSNDCLKQYIDSLQEASNGEEIKRTLENIGNASYPKYSPSVRLDIILIEPQRAKAQSYSEAESIAKHLPGTIYQTAGGLSEDKLPTSIRKCGLDIKVQAMVYFNHKESGLRLQGGPDLLEGPEDSPGVAKLSDPKGKPQKLLAKAISNSFLLATKALHEKRADDADSMIRQFNTLKQLNEEGDAGLQLTGLIDPVQIYARDSIMDWMSGEKGLEIPKQVINKMLVKWLNEGQLKKESVERVKRFYQTTSDEGLATWQEKQKRVELLGDLNTGELTPIEIFENLIARSNSKMLPELKTLLKNHAEDPNTLKDIASLLKYTPTEKDLNAPWGKKEEIERQLMLSAISKNPKIGSPEGTKLLQEEVRTFLARLENVHGAAFTSEEMAASLPYESASLNLLLNSGSPMSNADWVKLNKDLTELKTFSQTARSYFPTPVQIQADIEKYGTDHVLPCILASAQALGGIDERIKKNPLLLSECLHCLADWAKDETIPESGRVHSLVSFRKFAKKGNLNVTLKNIPDKISSMADFLGH